MNDVDLRETEDQDSEEGEQVYNRMCRYHNNPIERVFMAKYGNDGRL